MGISEALLPEFDQEMATTRRVLERVPDGGPAEFESVRIEPTPASLILRGEAAMSEEHSSPVETAKAILDAFNAHDLDRVMAFFAEDCSLDMPRGADPWGKRFVGKSAVREGLAGRFKGLPDAHYGEDRHWGDRNMVASEWLLTGTRPDGERVRVRGCDHYEFRDGKVVRKDSYWKLVEPQ